MIVVIVLVIVYYSDEMSFEFCFCRILGLPRFVRVDCEKPWIVTMSPNILWTYYLDVALLLAFYFILALEIRRRLEPVGLFAMYLEQCLQCFDAVGWATGRASGL